MVWNATRMLVFSCVICGPPIRAVLSKELERTQPDTAVCPLVPFNYTSLSITQQRSSRTISAETYYVSFWGVYFPDNSRVTLLIVYKWRMRWPFAQETAKGNSFRLYIKRNVIVVREACSLCELVQVTESQCLWPSSALLLSDWKQYAKLLSDRVNLTGKNNNNCHPTAAKGQFWPKQLFPAWLQNGTTSGPFYAKSRLWKLQAANHSATIGHASNGN